MYEWLQEFSYGLEHFAGPSLASFSSWDRPWWLKTYPKSSGVMSLYSCLSGRSIRRIALGYTAYRSLLGVGTTFCILINLPEYSLDLVYGVSCGIIRRIGLFIRIRRMLESHTPYVSSYVSRWHIGAGYAVSFRGIRRIGLGRDQNVVFFIDFIVKLQY